MTNIFKKLKALYLFLCLQVNRFSGWVMEKYDALVAKTSSFFGFVAKKLLCLKKPLSNCAGSAYQKYLWVRSQTKVRQKLKKYYSVFIALVPVLMFLNIPVLNMGVTTVGLVLSVGYVLLYAFPEHWFHRMFRYFPYCLLLIYLCWKAVGNSTVFLLLMVAAVHLVGAVHNSVDIRIVRKIVEAVAMIAALCVLTQTVLYYLFDYHLAYLQPWFILSEQHEQLAKMSIYGSMYRPSAFFMEPSHYTQYCCLGVLSVLFPMNGQKANLLKAFWIIMGCILTTSGIGILLCVIVFGWYILYSPRPRETRAKFLLQWLAVAVVAFIILMQFDFFSAAVHRIVGQVDEYNAISGRLNSWAPYLNLLTPLEELIGVGMRNVPNGYMTGLLEIVFCYGYIGAAVVLYVLIYIYRNYKDPFTRCVCVLWGVLLVFANLISFMSLSFWFTIMLTTKQDYADHSPE